jgi:hypothetical protein
LYWHLARRLISDYVFIFFDDIANRGYHKTVFAVMNNRRNVRIAHVDVGAKDIAPVTVFPF